MKTKTIQQTVSFKAAPQAVYQLLMNSKKHTSLSGEKAVISTKFPAKVDSRQLKSRSTDG